MPDLLAQLRALGLPMVSSYPPRSFTTTDEESDEDVTVTRQLRISWTQDEAKANAARDAGAIVTSYRAADPAFTHVALDA